MYTHILIFEYFHVLKIRELYFVQLVVNPDLRIESTFMLKFDFEDLKF